MNSSRATLPFTDVRCPNTRIITDRGTKKLGLCRRIVMAIPGQVIVEARIVADNEHRSGLGRVASCRACGALIEVIEHGVQSRG